MNCPEVREALPRYVDSRLPGDEVALVRSHLEECGDCRSERSGLERTDALVGAALSDHPFDDAALDDLLGSLPIRAAAARQRPQPSRGPADHARPVGMGLAAAAAVLLGVLLVFPPSGEPEEPVAEAPAPPPVVGRAGGTGLLRVASDGASEPLAPSTPLREGDRLVALETPSVVALPDGTEVALHADTEVSLRRDADGGLRVAFGGSDGELFCDVAEREEPFRVEARNLTLEVLGTRFLVHQGVSASRVVVEEGEVAATYGSDRRRLGADDAAAARANLDALELLRVTARDRGAWVPSRFRAPAEPSAPAEGPAEAPEPAPSNAQPPLPEPDPVDPTVDLPVGQPGDDDEEDGAPGRESSDR